MRCWYITNAYSSDLHENFARQIRARCHQEAIAIGAKDRHEGQFSLPILRRFWKMDDGYVQLGRSLELTIGLQTSL